MSEFPTLPSPGEDLERFITQITPPAALTWRALPLELPWTMPPGGGSKGPTDAALRDALLAAGVEGPSQWYVLNGPLTEATVSSPRDVRRNIGLPARAIEVAVEHDIAGGDLRDLADRLSLTDHKEVIRGGSTVAEGDPRGARRYLSRGRRILGALGVWPWAHVDEWRANRPWYKSREVRRALIEWHDRAWMDMAAKLTYAARARHGSARPPVMTAEEYEACRRFQSELRNLAVDTPSGGR